MSSAQARTREVELGPVADFDALPAQVVIADARYFLIRDGDEWLLLAAVCPHMGGSVEDRGDVFRCANHAWTFDRLTGTPVFLAQFGMSRFDVEERDGVLVAHILPGGWDGIRARQRDEARYRRLR